MFKLHGKIENTIGEIFSGKKFFAILYLKKIKKNYLITKYNLIGSGVILDDGYLEQSKINNKITCNGVKNLYYSFNDNYDTNHYPSIIIDEDKELICSTDKNLNLFILNRNNNEILFNLNLKGINNDNILIDQNNYFNKEIINIDDKKYLYIRIKTKSGYRIACLDSDINSYDFKNMKICSTEKYFNCDNFFHFKYKNENYLICKFIDNNNENISTYKMITPYEFSIVDDMFNSKKSFLNLEIVGYNPYHKNMFSVKVNNNLINIKI